MKDPLDCGFFVCKQTLSLLKYIQQIMCKKTNKILKLTTLVLFIALIFFCRGASVGMAFSSHDTGMMDMSSAESHTMPCCDVESPLATMAHDSAIMNGFSFEEFLTMIFGVFVASVVLFVLARKINLESRGFYYLQRLRYQYGSSNYFNFYISLFKRGILHPKTW